MYQCKRCLMKFVRINDLKRHFTARTKVPCDRVCIKCGLQMKSDRTFLRHIATQCIPKHMPISQHYECGRCHQKFTAIHDITRHYTGRTIPCDRVCDSCGIKFNSDRADCELKSNDFPNVGIS